MMSKLFVHTAIITLIFLNSQSAIAQTETRRLEVGAQYTLLRLGPIPDQNIPRGFFIPPSGNQHGVGGRLIFNPVGYVSFEAELNLFPTGKYPIPSDRGDSIQGLFGLKAGKRTDRLGLFAKLRPGFIRYSRAQVCAGESADTCRASGRVEFALDIGGVIEYYAWRHVGFRVDVGDTRSHYHDFKLINLADDRFPTVTVKGDTTHNLQVSFGVIYRF